MIPTYITEILLPKVRSFENSVPYMYLDTRGNATAGVGFMMPTLRSAEALPFKLPGGLLPANMRDIAAEWIRVRKLPFGIHYAAHHYHSPESLVLTDQDIDSTLLSILIERDASLRNMTTWFASAPDSVKAGVVDMAFNLGVAGLLSKYAGRLVPALAKKQWSVAAMECHRVGIADARNNWTVQQFKETV